MVYQQVRALSVYDTATARKKGYPLRISFSEFLRRYDAKFESSVESYVNQ